MAPLVLIIEDEAILRVSMARGLARLPGIAVAEAGSLDAAVAIIDEQAPALILSDIDLPGRSGLELLGELGKRHLVTPIVFISAYLKAYGSQIPRHANVDMREKPVGLAELRELVLKHVSAPPADAEPFEVTDYVQLACMGQRSVLIELADAARKMIGRILISAGQVWSAEDGGGNGEDAFRRLILSHGLSVRCLPLRDLPGERDVHQDWEGLLLDAVREGDEARHDHAMRDEAMHDHAIRDDARRDEAAAPRPAADFDTLWKRGVSSLREKDYAAALGAFLEAQTLRPDDWRVRANLERLRQLGHDVRDDVTGSE